MAFAPLSDHYRNLTAGEFIETSHGHHFIYSRAAEGEFLPFPDYGLKIYCGPLNEFRWAKVTASRAYLVVDEAADGSPVIERWTIRHHLTYPVTA